MRAKLIIFFSIILSLSALPAMHVSAKTFKMATPENPYIISVIGDSISKEPSYASVIGSNPNVTVNTYAIEATQVAGKDEPNSFVNRTKGQKFNSDLIMIMGGTNDYCGYNYMCNTLGDFSSTDTNTFCGAYNVMIKNIKKSNPGTKIALIMPLKRIGYTDPNAYGYSLTDYANAVRMIALNNNVIYIDLFNNRECDFVTSHFLLNNTEMHVNSESASYLVKNNNYFIDGLHPSSDGHRVIGNTLFNYISAY